MQTLRTRICGSALICLVGAYLPGCDAPPEASVSSGGAHPGIGGVASSDRSSALSSGGKSAIGGASGSEHIATGGTALRTTSGTDVRQDAGPGQKLKDYLGNSAFPDSYWQVATPTQSGMDSGQLEQALEFVQSKGWEIHAFIIARNGRLVFERYGWKSGNDPNDPDTVPHQVVPSERHPIFSVTKSITSALVGLAIADGFISGIDHKVADWFTDYTQLNPSAQKSSITLEHLLTMRSGLDFSESDTAILDQAESPARAVLSRDLASAPGSTWSYSSGDAEIVAEILRTATGQTPLDYAMAKLFGPLGIVNPPWNAGKSGTNHGGFGLSLTAREMARFGELYRNGGRWADTQVVPATWVTTSTAYKWPTTWGMDYGYYWFLPNLNDFFVAIGMSGQQIFVSRNYGLVIVFTGNIPSSEANSDYTQIIANYIVPAIVE